MESNWALNAWRYGLVGRLTFLAEQTGVERVLYARLLTDPLLLTNVRNPAAPNTALWFQITGDDRVNFEPFSAGIVFPPRPFPYGFPVEPDQPP